MFLMQNLYLYRILLLSKHTLKVKAPDQLLSAEEESLLTCDITQLRAQRFK